MSQEALNAFSAKFTPANQENHSFIYTTTELMAMLLEHTGVEVPAQEVYNHLIEKGFINDFVDGRFVWFFKNCPSVSAHMSGHSDHADSTEMA